MMTYTRNGEPMAYAPFVTGEGDAAVEHPAEALTLWGDEELEAFGIVRTAIDEPPPKVAEQICMDIDAEVSRRTQNDFEYDFGGIPAILPDGSTVIARKRKLQMRPDDQSRWQVALSIATIATMTGNGGAVQPIRVEDNANIQTTSEQVIEVLMAAAIRGNSILFNGSRLKDAVRMAEANGDDPLAIDLTEGWVP